MLVAWITNHRGNGFFIFRPGEGWEYVMTLTMTGVVIAHARPRPVEHRRRGRPAGPGRMDGLWIALGAGVGGAALLLAGFWRPAPKPTEAKS